MNMQPSSLKVRKGFTLVELAVVIVIIGVLAAFGVPKFLNSVERSKAAEAFAYLAAVRTAQERFIAKQGVYAEAITDLDIAIQRPKYFTEGTLTAENSDTSDPSWTMTLTRILATSSKGAYTVKFTQEGYDPTSTIETRPEINPSGTTGTTAPVTP